MKPQDCLAYCYLALAWGLSFLLVLKVAGAFGWVGAVTFRALVAAATLFVVGRLLRRRLDFSIGWRHFIIVGATTVAGQLIGITFATPRIGTAMAAIFVAAIPLFSMVIAQIWGIERATRQGLLGLALGSIGIVMLVGFPAVPVTQSFVLGCCASVFASFCAAFGSNYASVRLNAVDSLEITTGAFLTGGLMTLPLLVAVPVPGMPGLADVAYLVLLGVTMSAMTYFVYFRLVSRIGATKTISVEFAVTVVAVFVGAVVLGEQISTAQLAGAAVIILGCALVLGLVPLRRSPVAPMA